MNDPFNPVLVISIDTNETAKDVTMMEKEAKIYVLVVDASADLKIFDVTDPYNPVLMGSIETDGDAIEKLINNLFIFDKINIYLKLCVFLLF